MNPFRAVLGGALLVCGSVLGADDAASPPAPAPSPSSSTTTPATAPAPVPAPAPKPATNSPLAGPVDARMFRFPDVSASQITFVYSGDIWVAPKNGGVAERLSSPRGEELYPRFSPDGSQIAFTGNYDGNSDIYLIPSNGGMPTRLTYHGGTDRVLNWTPDGQSVLFASGRHSQKDRFNQLYRISREGGLPEQFPVPYGESAALSPDGKTLAYTPISVDFRTWKRYRGGMNPDIWFYDLEKKTARNITQNDVNDANPMWHGSTLYFLSDRDALKRANIWAFDTRTGKTRQVTKFIEFDVHFPSTGPTDMVFENGGRLYLMDLATEQYKQVQIQVVTDRATLKSRVENAAGYITTVDVSPNGKRAIFAARGEIFSVPAEFGVVRNLTRSSGVAERYPAWSPDAKSIAYFSDRSGEYELTLRPSDGKGEETTLTKLGAGFRYGPTWSPDSRKLVFIDQAMKIFLHDLDRKETRQIDQMLWLYHGDLQSFSFSWSSDGRWLTYAADQDNRNTAIVLYDTEESRRYQVTSGFYNDDKPTFDPEGKYLYFRTGRTFSPLYSDLDATWIYANSQRLAVVPLRKDIASPLAPRNDEELDDKKEEKKEEKKDEKKEEKKEEKKPEPAKPEPKPDPAKPEPGKPDPANPKDAPKVADTVPPAKAEPAKTDDATKPVEPAKTAETAKPAVEKKKKTLQIDLPDFERRIVLLPVASGNYTDLQAVTNKLVYRRRPRTGGAEGRTPVLFYDLKKREEKVILDDADMAIIAANGEKMLAAKSGEYAMVDVKEAQRLDKKLAVGRLEMTVEPAQEWKQIFADSWRLERDYFYDPNLHGVDWKEMRVRYSKLLEDAVTRWDVNYILGELIAELNASHTYRSGGQTESVPERPVGYLGVDYTQTNGAYQIKKIYDGAAWDADTRSPLRQPGLEVKEGEYLLAVNGVALDPRLEPDAAFQGLADKTVLLTLNGKPVWEGSREVLVQTLTSEARLRHLAWIEEKRRKVESATAGRVGYIYVADTSVNGQTEMVRQFRGQIHKQGLVIDERFNSGGQIPDRFIEMLNRPVLNYWGVRDGRDWTWPQVAQQGPKVMLINGWSGSGGDAFPYYFKKLGLGKLIGTRTWGGLIGMTGAPGLIDGGSVTVPTFGIYNTKNEWIIEGYGVDPDITVVDDPALMAEGGDPQLDRAITEVMSELDRNPMTGPKKPKYPNRASDSGDK